MKKNFLCCLIFYLMVSFVMPVTAETLPVFVFSDDVMIGFQGREAVVKVKLNNFRSVGGPVTAQLRDEEETVILQETFSSGVVKSLHFIVPNTWLGAKTFSMWVDGKKASDKDLFFAADNLAIKHVKRVATAKMRMSITIDAAYGDSKTLKLLKVLDEFGIKCTFFVTGNWAQAYPHHLREILERGHEIGNHSFSHPHLTQKRDLGIILRQIIRCSDAIQSAVGIRPTLFRPPYGETDEKLRALSRAAGCELIMWSVSSGDSDATLPYQKIVYNAKRNIGAGSIVLFHNDGKYIPEVLREVIPYYQSLGLELVPVSELLDEGAYTVNKEGLVEFIH